MNLEMHRNTRKRYTQIELKVLCLMMDVVVLAVESVRTHRNICVDFVCRFADPRFSLCNLS
jgi:hypothetical protein